MAAWLAVHTSKSAVVELLRIAWVTVGAIIDRVVAEDRKRRDPFDGLVRVGIDEISYNYVGDLVKGSAGKVAGFASGDVLFEAV